MVQDQKDTIEKIQKGVFASMVATALVHPLDVIKIRQQLTALRVSNLRLASQLHKREGWKAFYCGLSAGLMRQALNTATRLAMYDILAERFCRFYNRRPDFQDKILIGIGAGVAGGLVGNPFEVVLVRRMATGCRCPSPRCYCCHCQSVLTPADTIKKIICEEGFRGLWRGAILTLLRSVVISTVHLGAYFQIRDYLKEYKVASDGRTLSLYAAVVTSFVSAILSHPIDIVKTFYQTSNSRYVTQNGILRNLVCARGYFGLWKGFTNYFTRMALHTLITFIVLEQLNNIETNSKKR